jgi:hypothetical protein
MHNTIVCQLVFDWWCSPTNLLAQEYGPLEVASKSKSFFVQSKATTLLKFAYLHWRQAQVW